jgi:two-component system sensor histidine kinase BaeS
MKERDRLEVVAHELRSPVAALLAIDDALRDSDPAFPAADRRRLIELAIAAGRDIERLLADPELYSLRVETVDVGAIAGAFAAADVEVYVEPRLILAADPVRLRQVIGNLVANGLRHGSRVRIDARRDGAEVTIDVSDDGPGVDMTVDPFVHGVSGAGSTGLGLSIARRITEAHGGRLELVRSERGARFRLSLPRAGAVPR